MTYVVAGIRGRLGLWKELLKSIRFGKKDFLFVIGGFTGEGDESFDLLEELSYAENVWPIASPGDRLAHEMLDGFTKMLKTGGTPDASYITKMQTWAQEGGRELLDQFRTLDADMREGILDYLAEMPPVEKVTVNEKDYLMMFSGITGYGGSDPAELEDSFFFGDAPRADIDGYVTLIAGADGSTSVRREGNVISLDCGDRLCAYRLEDGKEYYVG